LAQVYPIIVFLVENKDLESNDMIEIAIDSRSRHWDSQLIDILLPWNTTIRPACDSLGEHAVISVPHLSFCTEKYWERAHILGAYLRARYHLIVPKVPAALIVIREDNTSRNWDVDGLLSACEDQEWIANWLSAGVNIICTSWTRFTSISTVAWTVGLASVFIAGHGAGLANIVFLRPQAQVIELDAVNHTNHNRQFYGLLAQDLGLNYTKIWVDANGHRLADLRPLSNCTDRRSDGSHIAGQSAEELTAAGILPYNTPAAINRNELDFLVARALISEN